MPDTPQISPNPTPTPALQLNAELSFLPCFNLALQQNAIPAVQELKLTNLSGETLADLTCVFSSVPEMILPKSPNRAAST